jgi:Tfp pilus assembly protein PilF
MAYCLDADQALADRPALGDERMGALKPTESSQKPNREQLLQMAVNAAKAGNKDGARVMLRQVLSEDRRNERAMLWLAKIARSSRERRQWLERVLDINPDNEQARSQLRRMDYEISARQNRTLLIYGVVAGVLFVLLVVVILAVFFLR